MRKVLCTVSALVMLLCCLGVAVQAATVTTDTIVSDFETAAGRALVTAGEYNCFSAAYAESTDVKATGSSAVRVTLGAAGDNLQDVSINFAEKQSLGKVEYVSFYFKNETGLPLGFLVAPVSTKLVTAEDAKMTHAEDFYKGRLGTYYVGSDFRGAAPPASLVKAVGASDWSEASNAAVGDKNGANAPQISLPAGFEGYIRVPLTAAERMVDETNERYTKGVTLRMAMGYVDDKVTAPQVGAYADKTFVIDDLTFGITEAVIIPPPKAPEGLAGVAPTNSKNNDGKITGVTNKMEYKTETATDYTAVTGTEVTGLASGTYKVRLKADGDTPAGEDASVVVPDYVPPKSQDFLRMVNDFETAAKVQEIKGVEYTFLGGEELIPSKAAKATGSQSAMMALTADTNNGFQKLLVTTKLGDLSKAQYAQFYVKWTGSEKLEIREGFIDAQMGSVEWWNQKNSEDPNWKESEEGKFWRSHIVINGNIGLNLVGDKVATIQILQDGKWIELTDRMLPGKFEGLVRFVIPESARKTGRAGLGMTLANSSENLSGDLYIDDIMVGMTGVEAAAGYDVSMADYGAAAGIKVPDPVVVDDKPGNNTNTGVSMTQVVYLLMGLAAIAVLFAYKGRVRIVREK